MRKGREGERKAEPTGARECDEARTKKVRAGLARAVEAGWSGSEQPQLSARNKGRGESRTGRRRRGPISGADAGPAPPVPRPAPPRPSRPAAGDLAQKPARRSERAARGGSGELAVRKFLRPSAAPGSGA